AQPSLRRARSLAVSPAALQGPEAPGPAEPGHVPYYACGACLQVPRDFLFSGRTAWPGLLVELLRQVVRLADARDQRQLGLDPVHVLFLGLEDLGEQVAADVVADRLAVGDRLAEQGQGVQLQRQVALEDLARTLADAQLAQRLEVRHSLKEQDPLGERVDVLHLVDGFLVLVLGQFLQAPVLQHLGVQEELVDRGQLDVERLVEELDNLRGALHGRAPWWGWTRLQRDATRGGGTRITCRWKGSGRLFEQRELELRAGGGQQVGGFRDAGAAARPGAGAHGEFGHRAAPGRRSLADF